jgi:hypothetical protein
MHSRRHPTLTVLFVIAGLLLLSTNTPALLTAQDTPDTPPHYRPDNTHR